MAIGSLLELTGLARFIRRFGTRTAAQNAFQNFKVSEPLDQIPAIVDRLGPRLEGRDVKDIDDLVAYNRRETEQLPEAVQQKLVRNLQAPATSDRTLLGVEAELEQALNRVAQQQIAAGAQMRADAVAPFMRLVEAQVSQIDQVRGELESHEQSLLALEKELSALRV